MANQDVEGLLMQAREAIKSGDVQRARGLVREILAADQQNVQTWVLATYLTNDPAQQRKFLDNAKKIAPDDKEVRRRERELFPPKPHGVFTPDPVQPPIPKEPARPPMVAQNEHIPTLADGIDLHPVSRTLGYLPWLAGAGGIVAIIVLLLVFNAVSQNQIQNSPREVVLRLYPALQAGDNATLSNLFTDDVRTLCANDFVSCFTVPINDFQSYSISSENRSTSVAVVRTRHSL